MSEYRKVLKEHIEGDSLRVSEVLDVLLETHPIYYGDDGDKLNVLNDMTHFIVSYFDDASVGLSGVKVPLLATLGSSVIVHHFKNESDNDFEKGVDAFLATLRHKIMIAKSEGGV